MTVAAMARVRVGRREGVEDDGGSGVFDNGVQSGTKKKFAVDQNFRDYFIYTDEGLDTRCRARACSHAR